MKLHQDGCEFTGSNGTCSGDLLVGLNAMSLPQAVLQHVTIQFNWQLSPGSTLRLVDVKVEQGLPLTGTMTTDMAGFHVMDPLHFNAKTPGFTVNSGLCTIMDSGRCAGHAGYEPGESCSITVGGGGGR
jgi:hypothetical protein